MLLAVIGQACLHAMLRSGRDLQEFSSGQSKRAKDLNHSTNESPGSHAFTRASKCCLRKKAELKIGKAGTHAMPGCWPNEPFWLSKPQPRRMNMKNLALTTAIAVAMGMTVSSAQAQETNTSSGAAASSGSSITCDNWYGRVDADGNGYISADEQRNHIESAFSALDKDDNGEVSQAEYNDCFVKPNSMSVSADRSQDNFGELDANSDQSIDMDEFKQSSQTAFRGMKSGSGSGSSGQSADAGSGDADNMLVIRRFIFLTPAEGQDPSALSNLTEDEAAGRAATTFAVLDKNGDGKISSDEWTESSPSYSEDRAESRFKQ
ncbi:MAG TPA: hypothetical protein VLQ68_13045, partial [Rhizobiaceae bacterium]|nr:hypothetical protein [Rhizobiaceae bacterium]